MNSNLNPLVSIGISFYNAEKYLEYAIKSVTFQSYQNWELILIDDGSYDKSLVIAKKFVSEKILLVSDGENRGLSYRLNQLIGLAKGTFFIRMDADDIMHPYRLENQVSFLINNPEVDVIGSFAYSIDDKNKVMGVLKISPHPVNIYEAFNNCCFIHPTVAGKIEWFRKNLYNISSTRMEDMELWSRTILTSNFRNILQPLLFYREVGVPTLSKYLNSHRGIRKLIRNNNKISTKNKLILLLKSYCKCLLYWGFDKGHMVDYLVKRRSKPLSDIEKEKAQKILLDILK